MRLHSYSSYLTNDTLSGKTKEQKANDNWDELFKLIRKENSLHIEPPCAILRVYK
jgi:hypothetical protein